MLTAKKKIKMAKGGEQKQYFVLLKTVLLLLTFGMVVYGFIGLRKKIQGNFRSQEDVALVNEIKQTFFGRINNTSLTSEEKQQMKNAVSLEEVKEILSTALTTRIKKNLTQCVLDKDGHIYVMEGDWINEEEIAPFYGIDLFSKKNYQEIRTAFLDEIKRNSGNWELVRNIYGIVGLKEKAGSRTHNWQGFKFTEDEEKGIREGVDDVDDNNDEVLINEENLVQFQIPVWYLGPSCYVCVPPGHIFCSDIYDPYIPTGLLFVENGNPNLPNNLIERNSYSFLFTSPNILLVEIGNNLNVYYTRINRNFFLEERN